MHWEEKMNRKCSYILRMNAEEITKAGKVAALEAYKKNATKRNL